jgi:hypothetical protein
MERVEWRRSNTAAIAKRRGVGPFVTNELAGQAEQFRVIADAEVYGSIGLTRYMALEIRAATTNRLAVPGLDPSPARTSEWFNQPRAVGVQLNVGRLNLRARQSGVAK